MYGLITELLGQGLQLSLANSLTEKTKLISYELIECFSQFDTGSSSQYLALYQVCLLLLCMFYNICNVCEHLFSQPQPYLALSRAVTSD